MIERTKMRPNAKKCGIVGAPEVFECSIMRPNGAKMLDLGCSRGGSGGVPPRAAPRRPF